MSDSVADHVPAGQFLQPLIPVALVPPGSSLYRPAAHGSQPSEDFTAVLSEYFPFPQFKQAPTDDAPTVGPYLPLGQSRQAPTKAEPCSWLYFPVLQFLQSDAELLPGMSKYWPTTQCLHVTNGEVKPSGQKKETKKKVRI
jgi:hypothetical protein